MTDHLEEIKALARLCIEGTIELFPDFDEGRRLKEWREKVSHVLIHLRAIQQEAERLEKEGRHS